MSLPIPIPQPRRSGTSLSSSRSSNPGPPLSLMYEPSTPTQRDATPRRLKSTLSTVDEAPEASLTLPLSRFIETAALVSSHKSDDSSVPTTPGVGPAPKEDEQEEEFAAVFSDSEDEAGDDHDDAPVFEEETLRDTGKTRNVGNAKGKERATNSPDVKGSDSGNRNASNSHTKTPIAIPISIPQSNNIKRKQFDVEGNRIVHNNGQGRAIPKYVYQARPPNKQPGRRPVYRPADPAKETIKGGFQLQPPNKFFDFKAFPPPTNKDYPLGSEKWFERAPLLVQGLDLVPALKQYDEATISLTDLMEGIGPTLEEAWDEVAAVKNTLGVKEYYRGAYEWRLEVCREWPRCLPPPPPRMRPDDREIVPLQRKLEQKIAVASFHQRRFEGVLIAAATGDEGPMRKAFAEPSP